MITVSIVVPVYNMADKLVDCIHSLLKQTYQVLEIILVDDGSTDSTLEMCQTLAETDYRIKVIHQKNQGAGAARNTGIRAATGTYVYFPDADDLLDSSAVDIMVREMESSQCDLLVFGFQHVDEKGKKLYERHYERQLINGTTVREAFDQYISIKKPFWIQGAPWNKCFKLSLLNEHSIYFPSIRRHQDEVFTSRYIEKINHVQFIPDVLYTYYVNSIKKEWFKYPSDYLDIAIQLKQHRMDIIGNWDTFNPSIADMIEREYIFNFIKGLELSFSKKHGFNTSSRLRWIEERIDHYQLYNVLLPMETHMPYQEVVLTLIQKRRWIRLYVILLLKVFAEKNMQPFFLFTKRLIKRST